MEQILLLTKEYSKNRHLEMIQRVSNNVMDELELYRLLIGFFSIILPTWTNSSE